MRAGEWWKGELLKRERSMSFYLSDLSGGWGTPPRLLRKIIGGNQ
jgi:hypothetical protein